MTGASAERRAEIHFQGVACDPCGQVFPKGELDENHWCGECRPRMQRRMRLGRHLVAAVIVLPFAIWIWQLEKFDFLAPAAWLLPLVAAYYLGWRIGREVVKGYTRWRRAR